MIRSAQNFMHVMCDVFKRYTCAISPGMIFVIAGFLKIWVVGNYVTL